jgi:hypothetical protein
MRYLVAVGVLVVSGCGQPTGPSPLVAPGPTGSVSGRALSVSAVYTEGPYSCPHGAPTLTATVVGATVTLAWTPVPSIHRYEIAIERYGVDNTWQAVADVQPVWEDTQAIEVSLRSEGRYRASVRVRTACGDLGDPSPWVGFGIDSPAAPPPQGHDIIIEIPAGGIGLEG